MLDLKASRDIISDCSFSSLIAGNNRSLVSRVFVGYGNSLEEKVPGRQLTFRSLVFDDERVSSSLLDHQ